MVFAPLDRAVQPPWQPPGQLLTRTELVSSEICTASLEVAAEICIYTNHSVVLETL